jgi:hypothetical protein
MNLNKKYKSDNNLIELNKKYIDGNSSDYQKIIINKANELNKKLNFIKKHSINIDDINDNIKLLIDNMDIIINLVNYNVINNGIITTKKIEIIRDKSQSKKFQEN